jgi:hypothetical protein
LIFDGLGFARHECVFFSASLQARHQGRTLPPLTWQK